MTYQFNYSNALYPALILIVAFFSVVRGFRLGITRQLASLLGFAFGAVAARVLTAEFSHSFQWAAKMGISEEFGDFTANLLCGVTVYFVVYWIFCLFTPILRAALSIIEVGMFNRLIGAFFSLVKNLLWLSIVLNLMLCFSSQSNLLQYERANDGNMVAAVMGMTHAILGCYGAEDFAHFHQLREAKTISCNFTPDSNVIKKRITTHQC